MELHTGTYCNAKDEPEIQERIDEMEDAAKLATKLKLKVAAGHGLNLRNITPLLSMPEIEPSTPSATPLSAGRCSWALRQAVGEMLTLARSAASPKQHAESQPRSNHRRL